MDSMGCVSEFSEDLKELGRSQLNVERSSLWTMDYGLWLYNVDDLFIVTSINIQRINMYNYAILMSYPILQCGPPSYKLVYKPQ